MAANFRSFSFTKLASAVLCKTICNKLSPRSFFSQPRPTSPNTADTSTPTRHRKRRKAHRINHAIRVLHFSCHTLFSSLETLLSLRRVQWKDFLEVGVEVELINYRSIEHQWNTQFVCADRETNWRKFNANIKHRTRPETIVWYYEQPDKHWY